MLGSVLGVSADSALAPLFLGLKCHARGTWYKLLTSRHPQFKEKKRRAWDLSISSKGMFPVAWALPPASTSYKFSLPRRSARLASKDFSHEALEGVLHLSCSIVVVVCVIIQHSHFLLFLYIQIVSIIVGCCFIRPVIAYQFFRLIIPSHSLKI